MRLFAIIFAVFAIIMLFSLALMRGSQNRMDMTEIENSEKKNTLKDISEESEESELTEQHFIKSEMNSNKNIIGSLLKHIGTIIFFIGTIISFLTAKSDTANYYAPQYGFSFLTFITYELIFCAVGFLFIGLSEIIRLLDNINRQLREIEKKKLPH